MGIYGEPNNDTLRVSFLTDQRLELIIEDEDKSATSAAENVGQGTLEEGTAAFCLVNLGPAVEGVLVHDLALGAARLHHHTTTDSVEGVRDDTRDGGDDLSDHPVDDEGRLLRIGQHTAGSVVEAEVGGTVDDNALHGDVEAAVQTNNAVGLDGLGQAVSKTSVLALS